MSLQLWITGNTDPINQGLANIDWNLPYTLKDGGKTGKCINFGVSVGETTEKLLLNDTSINDWSVSFWICDIDGLNDEEVSTTRASINIGSSNTNNFAYMHHSTALPEWTHYIYMQDTTAGKRRIYKNGVLISTTEISYSVTGSIYLRFGCFDYCDIRFYDHLLSEHEMSLIRDGLIFQHQLGRGDDPGLIDPDSNYGLSDTSGFKHDLTPSASIPTANWISDSPVGDGGVSFDGTFYLSFESISGDTHAIGSTDITISFWVYFEDWTADTIAKHMIFSANADSTANPPIVTSVEITNNVLEAVIATCSNSVMNSQPVSANIADLSSGWHMITITRNSDSQTIYIDANVIYTNQTVLDGAVAIGDGTIGKNSDGNPMSSCAICDVRIYATCKTAEEILRKYTGRSGIDSSGNLYSYSNSTSDADTKIGIGSNGNIKGEIYEMDDGFKMYADHYECSQYYEI